MIVPQSVRHLVPADASELVWRNELDGLTYEVRTPGGRRFVKWAPAASGLDLPGEAARMRWARTYTSVPVVVESGRDDSGSWLVTLALTGTSAVFEPWLSDPAAAVTAIGAGLRTLHDSLPVEACPYDWSAPTQVSDARRRAAAGLLDPAVWHDEHRSLTVRQALAAVARVPPVDQLVVCHGDACAPNTIIGPDGRCVGHVDLGDLGVGDRWADLAVATWSADWNYGPGWQHRLLDAYGVESDAERIAYYRLLWDLGP